MCFLWSDPTFGSSWSFTTLAARAIWWDQPACKLLSGQFFWKSENETCCQGNSWKLESESCRQDFIFSFLLLLCWWIMISRSLGERMRTRMIRTRIRIITTRENMMMQKIRTVVEVGRVSLGHGWRASLMVFIDDWQETAARTKNSFCWLRIIKM